VKKEVMHHLITWFGSYLSFDPELGEFRHIPLSNDLKALPALIVRSLGRLGGSDRESLVLSLNGSNSEGSHSPSLNAQLGVFCAHKNQNGNLTLSQGGLFFCAKPDGSIAKLQVPEDGSLPESAQLFLVTTQDLKDLQFIITNDWINGKHNRIFPRIDVKLSENFQLKIGENIVDIKENIPLVYCDRSSNGALLSIRLLTTPWGVDAFHLYKPLIYYVAAGKDIIFQQLKESLDSLVEFGCFNGDVLVICDRAKADLLLYVPQQLHNRIHLISFQGNSYRDFCTARYKITKWEQAELYQPILYVDTDIAFDRDIKSLLAAIAVSSAICAVREPFSPLASTESVGAKLFARENFDVGSDMGFNAGQMGIPNLENHSQKLKLIEALIEKFLLQNDATRWIDQPIANYTSKKFAKFDLDTLSRFARFPSIQLPADIEGRRGLVHFWSSQGQEAKHLAMQDFNRLLRRAGLGNLGLS
jgi:hypothetical protein